MSSSKLDKPPENSVATGETVRPCDGASQAGDIAIYYDGSCALCRREIGFLKSLDGLDCATFTDISGMPADSNVAPDVTAGTAMKRMHVRLADGRVVQGAAAFAAMWGASRRFRFVSRLANSRAAIAVLDRIYDIVLIVRPPLSRAVGRFDAWRERRRIG